MDFPFSTQATANFLVESNKTEELAETETEPAHTSASSKNREVDVLLLLLVLLLEIKAGVHEFAQRWRPIYRRVNLIKATVTGERCHCMVSIAIEKAYNSGRSTPTR